MQPFDQDELRRRAQEVLTRRVPLEPEETPPPPEPVYAEPRRPREPRPETPRPREFEDDLERRPREVYVEPLPPEIVTVEPTYEDAPMARTERRVYAETPDTPAEPDMLRARSRGDRTSQIVRVLHDRQALRQAVILAEILGKPVALREVGDSDTFGVF